ncbi:Tetratricopeptide-like helical domain and Tetratricopeptide repeat-containing domain and Tetratricopeptide repeat-containing protein [Strongyloides ratti]|uniref:Tetratricopeptide-like helical domain and Tetratricopeptide repeat-containing domain and Tetratricopeptide repeat-containing protein n=1 Tax=Strongyloides ratti TaxID=34506 RepID=A0A090MXP0_STRRB|nr:Tetratricopeptide-like helical domain and Tetratricopeptide repeat-containing domain and Tetratricopeptide repeat-containing protein [Strongyloides ratti]CEF65769.1 Tetratricopeptide-like helical domain and Tetratricopeptide repeat-containing domain and Tetratricopeptide repeat-containing protein [Strongyloides ratti]
MIRRISNLRRIFTTGLYHTRMLSSFSVNTQCTNNQGGSYNKNDDEKVNSKFSGNVVLYASILMTLKSFFGIEKLPINDDPIRELVKKAWFCTQDGKFDEAIEILEEAVKLAFEIKDEKLVTRIYSELGDVYYKMNNNEKANEYYKITLQRYIEFHKYTDNHPAFILTSIKLATVYADEGDIDSAELGYKHCIKKQMANVDEHLKKYLVSHGAYAQENNIVDARSFEFSDPLALYGYSLNTYAHFLINYRDESRLTEAEECMDESLKIAYTIYGSTSFHLINILNNFSSDCMRKKYYTLARKYLEIGINRVINLTNNNDLIVEFYCNYARTLYETGENEKAKEYAEKAVSFSKNSNENIQNNIMISCQFNGSFLERNYLYFICKLVTTLQKWIKVDEEKTLYTKTKSCAKKIATKTGDKIIEAVAMRTSFNVSPSKSDTSLIIKTANINLNKDTKQQSQKKVVYQKSDINFELQDQKRNEEIDENLKKRLNEAVEIVSQLNNITDWNFNIKKVSPKCKSVHGEIDYIENKTTAAKKYLKLSK